MRRWRAGLLENPTLTAFYTPPVSGLGIDGYREFPGATWVKSPECIAWQVDGLTFSNVIVVRAVRVRIRCTMPSAHRAAPSTVGSQSATTS